MTTQAHEQANSDTELASYAGAREPASASAPAINELSSDRNSMEGSDGSQYFLVDEAFALERCGAKAFIRRQRERSSEERRANDGLMKAFPQASRRFLVQRSKSGALQILSEHLVAIDDTRRLVVVGPVPVAGRFRHEEVRAVRRVMLAIANVEPRLKDIKVIALTTNASRRWGDDAVLKRMGYAYSAALTREGVDWLARITNGADVHVLLRLDDKQLLEKRDSSAEAALPQGRPVQTSITFSKSYLFRFLWWNR
jgi:hypothetical protein